MSTATGPLRSFLLWCEHIQGPLFMFLLSTPPGIGNPHTAASLHSPYPAPAPLGSKARPWPRTPELPLGNIKIPAAISNSSSHVHLQCCVLVSISWFVWFFFSPLFSQHGHPTVRQELYSRADGQQGKFFCTPAKRFFSSIAEARAAAGTVPVLCHSNGWGRKDGIRIIGMM